MLTSVPGAIHVSTRASWGNSARVIVPLLGRFSSPGSSAYKRAWIDQPLAAGAAESFINE